MPSFSPFLNPLAFPSDRYAPLADRLKRLLATRSDVVFVQGEAILALEAAATSLAGPAMTALNIVTSPYGTYFGTWLRRGGADVHDVVAETGRPIAVDAVRAALASLPVVDLVAVVHAETSNGSLNPLPEIADLAKTKNALLVVDGVASFGGHRLEVDALGIDVVVIGPQKAIGGPAGVSIAAVSPRAWEAIGRSRSPSPSSLSLGDIKENWLDRGRGALPGMPSALEFWALEAAIDQVEAEGLGHLIARHELAATATRSGLRALGPGPWIADDRAASTLVTSAPVPAGVNAEMLVQAAALFGVSLGRGLGDTAGKLVRLDHTGARAAFDEVLANVVGYGSALARCGFEVDIGAAAETVAAAYSTGLKETN